MYVKVNDVLAQMAVIVGTEESKLIWGNHDNEYTLSLCVCIISMITHFDFDIQFPLFDII